MSRTAVEALGGCPKSATSELSAVDAISVPNPP